MATFGRENCALIVSECLWCAMTVRLWRCSGHEDLPRRSSSSGGGGRTCTHEKINSPRVDSVGEVMTLCLGNLKEGVGSMSRK